MWWGSQPHSLTHTYHFHFPKQKSLFYFYVSFFCFFSSNLWSSCPLWHCPPPYLPWHCPICKFANAIHPIPLAYFTWPGAAAFSISTAFASKCLMPCTASVVRGPLIWFHWAMWFFQLPPYIQIQWLLLLTNNYFMQVVSLLLVDSDNSIWQLSFTFAHHLI